MKDADLEKVESDIVNALMEAGSWRKDETRREIIIRRNDRDVFTFNIEPVDEDTFRKCRRQNTRNKGKRTEELDDARFLSQLIFTATTEEDKNRLWRNSAIQKKLNVQTAIDVVNYVLKPGEKTKIAEVIADISGYEDEDTLDDIIKNG